MSLVLAASSRSRLKLADVRCAGPSATFRKQARRRPGVLGLCAISRPCRQFRRQTDGRMQRRGNYARAVRPFAVRLDAVATANCIPCRMPYITSMFMPRSHNDRPSRVPRVSRNFAFISQFVEIPDDVVFMVEYSVRAAQMAVYALLGVDREVPPITPTTSQSACSSRP